MKPWVAVLTALYFGILPAAAAAASAGPVTANMSSNITNVGQSEVRSGRTPGMVIAIIADGRIAYVRGFGYANAERKWRATADTEFYVGDLTHQFVAAAMLMLAQDRKIKLDDAVSRYLPELTTASGVTLSQLLMQTSGLPDVVGSHSSSDLGRSIKPADFIATLNATKPFAQPGTTYESNPVNYLLAGMVIERVTGEPLSDVLQQRIFVPLVMNHTFLAGDTGISTTRAAGYTRDANGFAGARMWDPAWLAGDRGVVTTARDLAKWDIEMPVLLREDAMRTMLTTATAPGATHDAMGWIVDRRGGKSLEWYAGELPGFQAANAVLPDAHMAVIVLTNTDALHGERVVSAAQFVAHLVDIVSPPSTTHLDNAVVTRAKEWLVRLAQNNVDRTQLTPEFSTYLSQDVIARANFAALGKLMSIVPVSSTAQPNGDTLYEFIVQFPKARYHYHLTLTKEGKIDELTLVD